MKQLKIDDLVYNNEFDGKIIIRKEGFENVYILDAKKKVLYEIFDTLSKDDKILPIYIKKISDKEYELQYYNLSFLIVLNVPPEVIILILFLLNSFNRGLRLDLSDNDIKADLIFFIISF